MRGFMAVGLVAVLAGCGNPQTSGIVAIGPDTYAVETRGRALATAVERGLTEATSFCTAQSRQTELLGTRINADSYQVAFRCTGGGGLGGAIGSGPGLIGRVPAGYATRNSPLGPIPVSAPLSGARGPVITGQAFPPARAPDPGLELGTVGSLPGRTATVAGNPFAQPEPAPRPSPRSLPPLSALPSQAAFQAPLPPAAAASTPVAPSPFAPLVSPLAPQGAAPAAFAPPPAPLAPAPAPAAPAPAFAPLQSPLAPAVAPAPAAAAPAFQPLASPAATSAPPAFAPLAPSQGLGSLPAASSALPAVAAPSRGLTRDVPPALPGPATVPAAAPGAPLGQPGVVPPAGFWNTPPR